MSKPTAQVNVTIKSENLQVSTPGTGIALLLGYTEKGKEANAEDLIASWTRFQEMFGGENAASPFATNVKQALLGGSKVRISRVTGVGATAGAGAQVSDGVNSLFTLPAKYKGNYYVLVYTAIAPPSNGRDDFFNVEVYGPEKGKGSTIKRLELFEDLPAPVAGTAVGTYTYLDLVTNGSDYVAPVYDDISAVGGGAALNPEIGIYAITGGLDGVQPIANEVAVAAVAFDEVDDGWILAAPGMTEVNTTGLNASLKAYADLRQDLVYLESIDNSMASAAQITAAIIALGNSSKFCGLITGGAKELDYTGIVAPMTGLGDVIGTILSNHNKNGVWSSPTNYQNGRLVNAVGAVNNFGMPPKQADRNLIALEGGNCIVKRNNTVMLWDFYSMGPRALPEKFLSIVFLEIYIIKVVKPLLEGFLNQPNTFSTWKNIWGSVKPFFDGLVADDALFTWDWQGDQFASSLADLQINNEADVLAGKYKVVLDSKTVAPMVDISLEILVNKVEGTVAIG